jgi:hypothetical protein
MANQPHVWLRSAIESAFEGLTAWPVANTSKKGSATYEPPYAVYVRTGTEIDRHLGEALDESPQPNECPPKASFTIEVYADSYAEAWVIANAISSKLDRFAGEYGEEVIVASFVTDRSDSDVVLLDGREQPTYVLEIQVEVYFQE